jgi:hypothetical protein
MSVTPTSLDFLASIIILIILVISGFALLGTGVLMAIGAVFSKRPLVTSWPADQESRFASFERQNSGSNSLAWIFSLLGAAVVAIIAVGIFFGVPPEKRDIGKDMNMSNLTKRRTPAPAPKPDAPPAAEAPKADSAPPAAAPAETPPAEAPAPKP